MTSIKISAALASAIGRIREIGPDAFRAEIEAHQSGDIATALIEIKAFASSLTSESVTLHSAVIDAIIWGAMLEDESFDVMAFQNCISANDCKFAIAA